MWSGRIQGGFSPPREAAPKALAAIQEALRLDINLSEAHARLAGLKAFYAWDWQQGDIEFRRAIDLDPSNATARAGYAHLLTCLGRFNEGAAQMDRALQVDPLNPFIKAFAGIRLVLAGRLDDGIRDLRALFASTPGFGLGYDPLAMALDREGRFDEALAAQRQAFAIGDAAPELVRALDEGYAAGGYRAAMRWAAQAYERRSRQQSGALDIASLYARAGDRDDAFRWIEKAYDWRDPNLPYIGVAPLPDDVRKDQRFRDLLHRMHLTSK